jgi:hypothetical protein
VRLVGSRGGGCFLFRFFEASCCNLTVSLCSRPYSPGPRLYARESSLRQPVKEDRFVLFFAVFDLSSSVSRPLADCSAFPMLLIGSGYAVLLIRAPCWTADASNEDLEGDR